MSIGDTPCTHKNIVNNSLLAKMVDNFKYSILHNNNVKIYDIYFIFN